MLGRDRRAHHHRSIFAFLFKKLQNTGSRHSADGKCHTSVTSVKKLRFMSSEHLPCGVFSVLIFRFDPGCNAEVAAVLFSVSLHLLVRGTCTLRLLFCFVDVFLLTSASHSAWKRNFTLCTILIQILRKELVSLHKVSQRPKG